MVDLGQLASEGKWGLSPPLHPSHTQLAKRFVLGLVLWRGAVLPESFPAQILAGSTALLSSCLCPDSGNGDRDRDGDRAGD